MRQIIKEIIEVKCNFCFNWINGPNLIKGQFNSCISCLNEHLKIKTVIHTPEGDNYKLNILKQIKWGEVKDSVQNSNIVQEVSEEQDQSPKNNKQLQSIQNDHRCKSVCSEIMDIKISDIKRDVSHQAGNFIDFERLLNQATTMSQFLDKRQGKTLKPHQSCVFNTPVKQKARDNYSSYKKLTRLQDFGRSLDKTRFLEKYQFYHDQNIIQSFIQVHPKIDQRSYKAKQFGNQILSNDMNRSMSLKNKIANSKSHRSNVSSENMQKLQGDQIKSKISCFLQSKYNSQSLTRLMTTYLKQAYDKTTLQNCTLELINYKISSIDMVTYLSMFDFQSINIIKLVNVDLNDLQIPVLINFIWDKPVQSLVLTGNKLTQNCLSVFLNKGLPYLKELYLGNNRINKGKLKQNVAELHSRFILYL